MNMSRCSLKKRKLLKKKIQRKIFTPWGRRCVIMSFTSRSSGSVGEAACRWWVERAILPSLTRICTRRRADNGSAAEIQI